MRARKRALAGTQVHGLLLNCVTWIRTPFYSLSILQSVLHSHIRDSPTNETLSGRWRCFPGLKLGSIMRSEKLFRTLSGTESTLNAMLEGVRCNGKVGGIRVSSKVVLRMAWSLN